MFTRLKNLDDRIFDNIPRIHKPAVNRIMVTASRMGNAGIVCVHLITDMQFLPFQAKSPAADGIDADSPLSWVKVLSSTRSSACVLAMIWKKRKS